MNSVYNASVISVAPCFKNLIEHQYDLFQSV
jgi:hypothetical protein